MQRLAVLTVLLMGTRCLDGSNDLPPELPLPERFIACDVPADCVAVELGCCDECNGGFAVAVNRELADEALERFGESPCGRIACTEMGCAPWVTDCVRGTCDMERGSF